MKDFLLIGGGFAAGYFWTGHIWPWVKTQLERNRTP